MPLFVWIALAIAILLVSGAAAFNFVTEPVAQAFSGPMGYVISGGVILTVAISVWNKTKKK